MLTEQRGREWDRGSAVPGVTFRAKQEQREEDGTGPRL